MAIEIQHYIFKLSGKTIDTNLFRAGGMAQQVNVLDYKPKALSSFLSPSPVWRKLFLTSTGPLGYATPPSTHKINEYKKFLTGLNLIMNIL